MLDSVKKAFMLSKNALKLFYVIAAVNIVANIINLVIIPAPVEAEMTIARSFLVIGITLLFLAVAIFVTGGMLAFVRDLVKTGAASLIPFVDNSKKYFARLLVIALILIAILILGTLLNRILGFLPAPIRIILMVIISVAVGLLLIMAPYALVANDMKTADSLKSGIEVATKNLLKILGLIVIMLGVYFVLLIAASIIIAFLSFILRPIANYITAIVLAIIMSVQAVLVNIAYMDFYLKSSQS